MTDESATSPRGAEPLGDWIRDALCREYPSVDFYPTQGERTGPAKLVCDRCMVISECLDYALSQVEKFGIWGGTSENERRHLRRLDKNSFPALTPSRVEAVAEALFGDQWRPPADVAAVAELPVADVTALLDWMALPARQWANRRLIRAERSERLYELTDRGACAIASGEEQTYGGD